MAKLAQLKRIERRDPIVYFMGKKKNVGKWLLNVKWTPELRRIAQNIATDDDGHPILKNCVYIPWPLRAMLAQPPKSMAKDVENGRGALLLMLVLAAHQCNADGKPLRRTGHKGRLWCDRTRKEWALLLHCTENQFDKLVKRLSHVLWDDFKGARWSRKKLLAPKGATLAKLWNTLGKQYVARLFKSSGEPFLFP